MSELDKLKAAIKAAMIHKHCHGLHTRYWIEHKSDDTAACEAVGPITFEVRKQIRGLTTDQVYRRLAKHTKRGDLQQYSHPGWSSRWWYPGLLSDLREHFLGTGEISA